MGRQRRRSRPIDYKVPESRGGKVFEESADGARVGNIVRDHLASLFGDFGERSRRSTCSDYVIAFGKQYVSFMRN